MEINRPAAAIRTVAFLSNISTIGDIGTAVPTVALLELDKLLTTVRWAAAGDNLMAV